jgi:hypothetical protein
LAELSRCDLGVSACSLRVECIRKASLKCNPDVIDGTGAFDPIVTLVNSQGDWIGDACKSDCMRRILRP